MSFYLYPSLLPGAIEPVWCPQLQQNEEQLLAWEESAFEAALLNIRKQPAPTPMGARKKAEEEEEEANEMVEEEEEEEEEDEEEEEEEEEDIEEVEDDHSSEESEGGAW
uniref:Uncharacterized protein n=1 Tax=Aplanochytrium stocchinoi TaxID=215587 RepID=A0A7S3PNW3_9STRA|mmetsp:Transcript_6005/g.6886  ORF Transcript_6005/g.6886 Transcript_6005/m.6886 type:complete len:109 (+) Transcript_6005:89-415(+)|eukprot:CAMPEP_0204836582 /NCGR_PEP_ID=MMETSP1346-20131115/25554_1 /ASSEMBLY_ACC=CAM_ASM_000771 /TAXON_ID=215587 /ORGANISM="Aplanochytrium stocchinoi, Strain GSBS06" /LENGTH=108 /DNA_ID=CAMNT_0051971423 /DNA_START=137 /DNA_END=463 /DNA_ORIENTATION=+